MRPLRWVRIIIDGDRGRKSIFLLALSSPCFLIVQIMMVVVVVVAVLTEIIIYAGFYFWTVKKRCVDDIV